MKKSILIALSFFALSGLAQQNATIDARLLVNKELAAKAQENFNTNPSAYDFMLFELEKGWFTQSFASLTEGQKSQLQSISGIVSTEGLPFDPAVLANPAQFNFHAYNFQRHATKTVGYDLGNGTVLVFYSTQKLQAMFEQKNSSNQ